MDGIHNQPADFSSSADFSLRFCGNQNLPIWKFQQTDIFHIIRSARKFLEPEGLCFLQKNGSVRHLSLRGPKCLDSSENELAIHKCIKRILKVFQRLKPVIRNPFSTSFVEENDIGVFTVSAFYPP